MGSKKVTDLHIPCIQDHHIPTFASGFESLSFSLFSTFCGIPAHRCLHVVDGRNWKEV
jgi:hypothetical protein